ncbi:MAG: DUF748 domain-containing protein [Planctomycetes bacterium]|jgi:uncharacterized protein involved in outer membrane biogenesis|nr:DUF748 domain-containing protein [Planctomycetota bacterium]
MSTAAPTRRPRRWRRWLWRLALGAVVARLLLALFLPQLIAFGAGFAGLRATMRSASLSLLGLSLRIEDLELRSADHASAPPLLTAQDLVADLSLRQLLRGELLLVDAALGGATITVQRTAAGELLLPKAWTATNASVTAAPPAEPGPISFALPLRIGSARLHDVELRWQDLGRTPAIDERCTIDVDARELGHPGHPGQLTVRLHSPRWFDELWLQANAITEVQRLQLDWRAAVRGVRPAGLPLDAELSASLAFADALGADLRGQLTGAIAPASPRQGVFRGELDLDLRGDGNDLLTLHAEAGPSTTTGAGPQLPFQLALQAPGLVQQLTLSGGELQLGPAPSVRGELRGTGVTLAHLRPLLAARGLELPADGLRAQLGFDAEFGERLSLQLRDLELAHRDDRLALAALHVRELQANDTGLAIDSIELQRPQLALQRTAAGGFHCAGITFTPVAAAPAPTQDPTPAPAATPRLPRLRLGSLALLDGTFVFTDRTRPEPAVLTLSSCTLRGDAWTIGQDAPPGRCTLQARLDDAIEQLQVEATIAAKAQQLTLELQAQATAMTLQSLRPWLQPAGLEPRLANGSLTLVAGTTITEIPTGLEVELRLANLRYRAGDELRLGVRAITGTGLRLGADRFELGSWRVDEPFLDVQRTADGGFELLGLALPPAAPTEPDAPAPDRTAPTEQPAAEPAAEPAAALAHGPLLLQGGVVQWRDADAAPLQLGFDGELAAHAATGPQAFTAALRLDGAVDRVQLRGTLQQVPLALAVELELQGLRGQGLQRFLPPHVRCTLVDGAAQAKLQLQRAAAPGTGVQLQLDAVQLRDRDQELVGFDQLRLDAPALGADRIHIAALVGTGLRGQVTFGDDGLHVPGFLLTARAPRAPEPPPADPNAPLPHRPPVRIPLLQVDLVDVTTAALVLRDRRGGDGEPLQLTGRLFASPWAPALDRDDPEPARLQLVGTALPLCRELRSELQLHLYDLAPSFELQFAATGIDFTAVPKLVPALAAATGTTAAASLRGQLHGRLDLKRRDPRAFDPQRPFAGELLLENVELRDDEHDRSLASLGSLDVIARTIDPRRGDTLLRAIDIDRPQLVVDRTADGALELFGLRLPAPPPNAASAAESAAAPATTDTAAPPPTPAIAAADRPEFAVDRLVMQGAALQFTDHTTVPPTPLPIADGDLELLRFSTRAFTEPRPLRLRASLRGGDVPLERRVLRSSMLAGVIASTAAAVGGADDVHQVESRPSLDEMTLRGDLVLFPRPSGEVVAEVLGLELPLLRGFAKQGGVEIADGLLDQRTTVLLRGADGATVDSRTVFTWLSLTEPPGGPISTYLRLPAPLDSVLFLLRNDADEHRIPMQLEIPGQGLSGGAVVQAAAEAVIKVLADAVASAALRTTGMVTGAIGLSGGAVSTASGAQTFAAGDPLPAAGDLQPVLEALAADPTLDVVLSHEVGAADLVRARALATPEPARIAARVEELRQQRQQLLTARQPLAAELQALYAGAKPPAARALQAQLLAHDDRLGELERTLDQALAMLASDDPRARQRRTQAALQAIAAARLDAVALELRTALPELAADRIVRRPGRAVPTAGLDGGGRITAAVRRRNLQ